MAGKFDRKSRRVADATASANTRLTILSSSDW